MNEHVKRDDRAEAIRAAQEYMSQNDLSEWEKMALTAENVARTATEESDQVYYKAYAGRLRNAAQKARTIVVIDQPPRRERRRRGRDESEQRARRAAGFFSRLFHPPQFPEAERTERPGVSVSDRIEEIQHGARRIPREVWMPILALLIGLYLGGSVMGSLPIALVLAGVLAREAAARAGATTAKQYAWGLGPSIPLIAGSYGFFIAAAAIHIFLWNSLPWLTRTATRPTPAEEENEQTESTDMPSDL